jgi:hypothetical protein
MTRFLLALAAGLVGAFGAAVVAVAVWWMDVPLAQSLTFLAGVLFFGVASALAAGAKGEV